VTFEDACLLANSPDALNRQLEDAKERLARHFELEGKRIAERLETDFERYLRGGETRD